MKGKEKNNKKKKLLIVLIIVILLLIIVGFIIYKVFFNDKIIITIKDGDEITKIEASLDYEEQLIPKEKEGYKFNYYKVNNQILDTNKLVHESIIIEPIYIKENANTSKVKFIFDEFQEGSNISVEFVKGENIVLPTIPFKEGYIFTGWKDANGNILHSGLIVTEDLLVMPTWEESKFLKSNGIYSCEHYNEECLIDENNKCQCEKRDNALVKSYACKEGSVYNEKEKNCIIKEEPTPTCNTGIYDESAGGCKIETDMIKTCAKGYLIQGKCYSDEYDDWTYDYSCNGYLFMGVEKCFTKETNAIMACPKGYTKDSNSCYKIETPSYCKIGYEFVEENGNKTCIQKSEKVPLFSCEEDYTLENYICIKRHVERASKL